jgi:repressor LexA
MALGIMDGFGARVREARRAKKMTLDDLAARVGELRGEPTHFTTIAKIERAQRSVSLEWVDWLAKALGEKPERLLGTRPQSTITMVPLVGTIAAGNWKEAVQHATDEVPVPDAGPRAFALTPSGNSMDKVADESTIIIVDPDQLDLHDGHLYAIMNAEGETTFKQFRASPPRLEPMSTDPEHKAIPLGREPFTVIGRVTWQMKKM